MAHLDLGVPVSALHQPDEELAVVFAGEAGDPFAHRHTALLVGLDGEAEAFVAAAVGAHEQRIVLRQRLDDIHRQLQPVGFLGIDGEVDVRIARLGDQRTQHGHEVRDGLLVVEEGVFRMQCRQLHRNAGRGPGIARSFTCEPVDRAFVAGAVAFGIVESHRAFAQHVEAVGQPLGTFGCGALERFVDGASVDELAAEDAHGLQRGLADDRFAQPRDRVLECAAHALLRFFGAFEHLAGQHQREGRRIDEGGGAFAEVLGPVDIADLVADQRVGSCCIGHAQQGFGKAHQRHAFFSG